MTASTSTRGRRSSANISLTADCSQVQRRTKRRTIIPALSSLRHLTAERPPTPEDTTLSSSVRSHDVRSPSPPVNSPDATTLHTPTQGRTPVAAERPADTTGNAELSAKLAVAEAEVALLRRQLRESQNGPLGGSVSSKRDEDIKADPGTARLEIERLTEENMALKTDRAAAFRARDRQVAALERERAALSVARARLGDETHKLRNRKDEATTTTALLRIELASSKARISSLDATVSTIRADRDRLEMVMADLEHNRALWMRRACEAEEQLATIPPLKLELAVTGARCECLGESADRLVSELEAAQKLLKEKSEALVLSQSAARRMERSLKAAKTGIDLRKDQCDRAVEQARRLERIPRGMRCDRGRDQLSDPLVASLRLELDKRQTEVAELQAEVARLKDAFQKQERQPDSNDYRMIRRVFADLNKLSQSVAQTTKLQADVARLKEAMQKYTDEVRDKIGDHAATCQTLHRDMHRIELGLAESRRHHTDSRTAMNEVTALARDKARLETRVKTLTTNLNVALNEKKNARGRAHGDSDMEDNSPLRHDVAAPNEWDSTGDSSGFGLPCESTPANNAWVPRKFSLGSLDNESFLGFGGSPAPARAGPTREALKRKRPNTPSVTPGAASRCQRQKTSARGA